MATEQELVLARKLLSAIKAGQAQHSLSQQAKDCVPVLEALGYYDVADYLRDLYDPL